MNNSFRWFLVALFLISFSPFLGAETTREKILEKRVNQLERELNELRLKQQEQLDKMQEQLSSLLSNKNESIEDGDSEIDRLRALAKGRISTEVREKTENETVEKREFEAGNLGLQAGNPEISVTGDVLTTIQSQQGVRKHADAAFRTLGIHFETYLDPYTRFKAAYPVLENNSLIGEAYITRYGFAKNLNLTLGKFRQQFGVVNRWHKHGLDFVDFPLPLRRIFGDGGLNQMGVAFDWNLGDSRGSVNDLTLQLTESTNGVLFGQNTRGYPSVLAHYKNYRDLDENTYQEIGLTAMAGLNDQWNVMRSGAMATVDRTRPVYALGIDFTRFWEPADNMRYRNFTWRTELYGLIKDVMSPDDSGKGSVRAWGGYTNFQWKLNRLIETGLRLDYFKPDTQTWAAVPGQSLYPLAVPGGSAHEYQFCPYITWHQSPWVRYRLEFNYKSGHNMGPDDRRLMLQCIWAAGPHKHERY